MYVGSSSSLARRLIGYFNNTHGVTGKLIPLIKREGIGAFKLEVILLTESYAENKESVWSNISCCTLSLILIL